MTAFEFFTNLIFFAGEFLSSVFDVFFNFTPVNIVLSVIIGVLGFSIVFGIIRGRKM